ncbi:MAG TPA: FecR domain-containing protein, partial [Polyangiales bacterium]|nr:FecR domain-containing protein [Polyangiales bacterium]
MSWRSLRGASLLIVLVLVPLGCERCGEPPVAELVATLERVERDHMGSSGRWQPAKTGARFAVGDGLRTFARSRAELALSPAGRLQVEQDTTVRFSDRPDGAAQRVAIEAGEVEVEAEGIEIELRTEDAVARVERGTRVHVRSSADATRFDVRVGKVQIERGAERRSLVAGDAFELQVGVPFVELTEALPIAAGDAGAAPAGVALDAGLPTITSALDLGAVHFDPPIAGRPELIVPAGEQATIHHPAPPLRVRIAHGGCAGELAVEVQGASGSAVQQRMRGRGGALLRLGAGQYRYRVLCIVDGQLATQAAQSGVLRVRANSATRPLSVVAPHATVDADGRRYTVRYQNLLPALTLRWPNAPGAPSYLLRIEPERGAPRTQSTAGPVATLPAGALGDGGYRFSFQAGSARSPLGSLLIAFDQAGRSAYLSAPNDRGFAAG